VSAGVVTIVAVVLIVLALVYYLVSTILALRKITKTLDVVIGHVGEIIQKSEPVNGIVQAINQQLDAGVELLEGMLVQKAGMTDAVGLVEGLYPGSAAAGFRSFPESTTITAPRIGEVYTQGTLTLARLGREAPIAVGNPAGPALRDVVRASLSARVLYPEVRQTRPEQMPRSPIIGTDSPVVYPRASSAAAPRRGLRRSPRRARGRRSPPKGSSPPRPGARTRRESCSPRTRSSEARRSARRPGPRRLASTPEPATGRTPPSRAGPRSPRDTSRI
jgi:hypothetical protein